MLKPCGFTLSFSPAWYPVRELDRGLRGKPMNTYIPIQLLRMEFS